MKAPSPASSASIRASACSTSSVGLTSPARTAAACSSAVRSCSWVTDGDARPACPVDRARGPDPRRRRGPRRRRSAGRLPRAASPAPTTTAPTGCSTWTATRSAGCRARPRPRSPGWSSRQWGEGLVGSWATGSARRPGSATRWPPACSGAAPGEVLVGDSTSVNLYKLLGAGARRPGPGRDVLVCTADDFPTDRYIVAGVAEARGMTVRELPADIDEGLDPATLAAALDDRVAVVVLSHVAYRSGALADLAAITRLVHDAGALVLWDLSHAVGAVPVGAERGRRRPRRRLHVQVPQRRARGAGLPLRAARPAGAAALTDPGLVRPARPVRDGPGVRARRRDRALRRRHAAGARPWPPSRSAPG